MITMTKELYKQIYNLLGEFKAKDIHEFLVKLDKEVTEVKEVE